eukprot:Gb_41072 [translate_table: standard]
MSGYRSRPLRGISTTPVDMMSYREPFSVRPPRPRNSSTTPRKSKYGSENTPPENENIRANSNISVEGGYSPAPNNKSVGRSRPPRPPPSRPTPAKRKLSVECQPELTGSVPDKTASDTGVKVIIRMRPLRTDDHEATQVAQMLSPNTIAVVDQQFTFDAVAGTDATQKDIFDMVGLPLVENCMAGFNSSIFAYGQTGSGKTYTMWGPTYDLSGEQFPNKDRGLTPRVFEQLFTRIQEEEAKNVDKQLRYQCRCSFLEIYNEQITDLLEPNQRNLQIREDTKTGVYVENLTEEYVSSVDDVTRLALRGLANRRVGATSMNAESSRSHSVFTCVLESRCKSTSGGLSSLRTSRINLVDLAGSERQKLTGAAGERLKEAGNINRSLSQLGNLIKILAEVSQTGKQRHIPYRDSRLTFLLQESLGGNAKLAMVCAISPAGSCRSETLSTLRFAQRAKAIQNKAVVNEETENDVNLLRDQIRQLKDELMRMKSKDNNQPTSNGSYSTSWNARRSYNLLRMSLKCPLILPHTDTDSDEEMEIDEDAVEGLSDGMAVQSTNDDESAKDSRTSSSSEKEEIQTHLYGLQSDNIVDSTKIKPKTNLVGSPEKDLGLDGKELEEVTDKPSPVRDVKMSDSQPEINSCLPEDASDLDGFEKTESVGGNRSYPEAHKEDCLLTLEVEHCESTEMNHGASEVELTSNSMISEAHPTVLTDHQMLIDNLEVHPQNNPIACDVDIKDGIPSNKKPRTCASNDYTESSPDAPVIENCGLDVEPHSMSPNTLSIVPLQSSPILQSPTLSVSPRIQDGRRSLSKSFRRSTLSPPGENGNSKMGPQILSVSFAQSVQKSSHIRSDNIPTSPTDRLAASLQRGLQMFDHHQQNSAVRKSSVRFSFQTLNLKPPLKPIDKVDKGIQTSPKKESCTATSPIAELLHASCGRPHIIEQTSLEDKEDMQDKSQGQIMPLEETKCPAGPSHQVSRAVEGVLAGSIRREMALEEVCNKQAAEIEHLNRLVRQYKHERECNSLIQQTREDKIVRLEGLMDGAITSEEFLKDELASLAFEHKLLQDKYENHPEVTRANIEEKRLLEELEKYRNFYELGERDALIEEVQHLRTQLQCYLDSNTSIAGRKLRMSLTNQAIQRFELSEGADSVGLCTISEVPVAAVDENNGAFSDKKWEEENRQWTERESEWISLVDDLRAEIDSYSRLAEQRKKEVENEQKCSEELKEALQMAMEGHARILDQYAELQEKHIGLLAKHRKIREGVVDVKRAALMVGVKGTESHFIEAQAAELIALKLDKEQECQMMKDEIKGLQAQLRDTVEAVQAAGELLVRLKEAEEAVSAAQDAAAITEKDAEALRRDMEKLKRRHATEMATLNQRLLECRLQKSTVCPMCQVAERVKFGFPDADNGTLEAESAAKDALDEWRGELQEYFPHEFEEHDEFLRVEQPSWFHGDDKCNI